ncbi:MAG TPA: DUF1385 domain-containing protein [Armatimonadota bacterium]|nr:DUF1385 domain-containing protein [Armatimonadota bacterium]
MADRSAYGGQAVIEGVMIRGKNRVATACRLKDGSITVRHEEADSIAKRYSWLRLAFLRGTPALIDSMQLGYRTLMWSADMAMDEEAPQQKPPAWLYFLTILGSVLFGVGLFVLFPTYALKWVFPHAEALAQHRSLLAQLIPTGQALLYNITEGLLRILILIGYILMMGRNAELRRVFSYHGAEHKVVNAWEGSGELSVDVAKRYSRIHPRCGTSFLFLFFIVGILMHALIGWPAGWIRVASRLIMLPLVAGVAYELIRLSGRFRNSRLLKMFIWPGLLLQQLTTAEPADDQIEVAIKSLRTVLEDEGVLTPEPDEQQAPLAASTEHTTTA